MTRHKLEHILEVKSFDERRKQGLPIFDWEHYCKSFQNIPNDLAMKHLIELDQRTEDHTTVLKCRYNSDVYFFGVNLKDCDNISLKKLKKLFKFGTWSVYTWSD